MPLFFCACPFSIFVLRSKRIGMLKGITWGQFSIFILVVTVIYYLYVYLRFFTADVRRWLRHKPTNSTGTNNTDKEEKTESTSGQGELFKKEVPENGEDKLFGLMQQAITTIRQVIAQGIENRLDRENLLDHVREVLRDYRQLKDTEYAETINNFLMRVCSSELSLELGEGEAAVLWR